MTSCDANYGKGNNANEKLRIGQNCQDTWKQNKGENVNQHVKPLKKMNQSDRKIQRLPPCRCQRESCKLYCVQAVVWCKMMDI